MQRWAESEQHFERALEVNQRIGAAAFVVRTQRAYAEMLLERGFPLNEPVASEGAEPEVVAQFRAAHEVAMLVDRGDADPGDVAAAIDGYRAVFEHVVSERQAP